MMSDPVGSAPSLLVKAGPILVVTVAERQITVSSLFFSPLLFEVLP